MFFRDAAGYVHHVGISMGGDKFLHAPHTGDVVKVSSLDEPYYKAQFTGGRRFDDAGAPPRPPRRRRPPPHRPLRPRPRSTPSPSPPPRPPSRATRPRRGRQNSGLFKAIYAQEARNHAAAGVGADRALASAAAAGEGARRPRDSALFLKAITAEQAAKARRPPRAPSPTPAAPRRARRARPRPPRPRPPPRPAPAGPPPDLSAVPADYPGDNAGQEALAKWLAKQAEKAGLPPELPVMAALVESGVKNLNFGDADSVGFFQMRVSIWNQGEYAGYPENPGLQAKWFIDHAVAHKKQQIARGRRRLRQGPATLGRVDRRRRASRRAVPRPLPAAARRGAAAAPLSRPSAVSPRRRRR